MSKKELFEAFCGLFPEYAKLVVKYKKFGGRTLNLHISFPETGEIKSLMFLYYSDDNWGFGTKLWRRKPSSGRPTYEETIEKKVAVDLGPTFDEEARCEYLIKKFQESFPEYINRVIGYKITGYNRLEVIFNSGKTKPFIYKGKNSQLGESIEEVMECDESGNNTTSEDNTDQSDDGN